MIPAAKDSVWKDHTADLFSYDVFVSTRIISENKRIVCKSVNQKRRRIIYHQTKSTLLLWNTVVAYLGSWLFRCTGSCACPFWAVKRFSTPNSIAKRANPTHCLWHSLSLSFQKTLTSVHIFFHQELPVKRSQLMQCRAGEEVGGRASCPAPTLLLLLFCLSSCFHFFFFFPIPGC